MSLDIKELYKSDLDPNYSLTWWSTKKVEKLNWNFDRIEESEGGPLGPQGWLGKSGSVGLTGVLGSVGRQGPVGNVGTQGFTGENEWIENLAGAGDFNSTILINQSKDDPDTMSVGYSNIQSEYSLVFSHSTYRGSINRWNTPNAATWNAVFTSGEIDGGNTDLSTRKSYFWNLQKRDPLNIVDLRALFELGFHNIVNGKTKFFSNQFIFQTPLFTNDGSGALSNTTTANLKSYLTLDSTQFNLDPSVISTFNGISTFSATKTSGAIIDHKFGPNTYSNPSAGKIAYTNSPAPNGTVLWGDAYDVIGGFPIGSIIAIDDQFIDDFFYLEETGTIIDKIAVSGFINPSIIPSIEFKYGAGRPGTKFEGWYLCNGEEWYRGAVTHKLPNLCGFDYSISYDIFDDILLMGTPSLAGNFNQQVINNPIQGSAVIKFNAVEDTTPGVYLFNNGIASNTDVLESYVDVGEPLAQIYQNSGSISFDYKNGTTGKGLIYVCYLGLDGYRWNTDTTAPLLYSLDLSYSSTTPPTACAGSDNPYKSNFNLAWTDSGTWTTNGNKLYNAAGSAFAPSGYYHSGGIVRFWNASTGAFTNRLACPSYTGVQLVKNASVISGAMNGTWSTRTTSLFYINASFLSSATLVYSNSAGTTVPTAGWFRGDNGACRRYWNGTSFEGAIFTLDYVNYLADVSSLIAGTTVANACSSGDLIYGYYEVNGAFSKTFSGSSGISFLFTGSNNDGTTPLYYAISGYYYGDGTVRRQGSNSNTGAIGTAVSCNVSSPPSGPSSGGGSGGGCVLFGTRIKMANGTTKLVQDISVGDSLASKAILNQTYSEKSELYKWSSTRIDLNDTVVKVISNRSINTNVVYSINDGKFFTSADHNHIYKNNGVWRINKTDRLEVGDSLISENGNEIMINSIVAMTGQFIVYNIDVDNNNTYIANEILTHNKEEAVF